MINNYRRLVLFSGIIVFIITQNLQSVVADVIGDLGTAQSGSLIVSGGTSGAVFDSTTQIITQRFNFISLPVTTATNGQILFFNEPVLHNFGLHNQNIFAGGSAGNFTTSGVANTACGNSALNSITIGNQNTAMGPGALLALTSGIDNTAAGASCGANLVSGNNNILIGTDAASSYTSNESNNIILGNAGVAGESNVIRIGVGGVQTDCFIGGIYDSMIDMSSALPVLVDQFGKLGVVVSSSRFKDTIKDMCNDSSSILNLRPVSFTFKTDTKKTQQFGLMAEDVHTILPSLVIKDKQSDPLAVKYSELPVLMLNELQKAITYIAKLEETVQTLETRITKLQATLIG